VPAPPIPPNCLHFSFGLTVGGSPCSFGFWIHAEAADALSPADFSLAVYDFYTFHMGDFLDAMSTETVFTTCRIERGPPNRYVHFEDLAPNHGAQSGGTPIAMCSGIYLAVEGGGRGSGTRLHLPGLPGRFVTEEAKLSGYGLQQLVFVADSLLNYPARLTTDWSRFVELVTVNTKRNGAYLPDAGFTPVIAIRPTHRLPVLSRRLRASGGFSAP